MTENELIKVITDAENDMHINKVLYNSPGYAHIKDLYVKLKADKDMQTMACNLFKIDPLKLPEMFAAGDHALLLEDNIVAHTDGYTGLLEKLKQHDFVLKTIAKLLG